MAKTESGPLQDALNVTVAGQHVVPRARTHAHSSHRAPAGRDVPLLLLWLERPLVRGDFARVDWRQLPAVPACSLRRRQEDCHRPVHLGTVVADELFTSAARQHR